MSMDDGDDETSSFLKNVPVEKPTNLKKKMSSVTVLKIVFAFTLIFSIAEFVAGQVSNSLLLFEESVHMFADSVSFGFNLWAEAGVAHSRTRDLIGTGISLFALVFTLLSILIESIRRFVDTKHMHSTVIDAPIMLAYGSVLCLFHLLCLFLYFRGLSVHEIQSNTSSSSDNLHSHSHHSHDHHSSRNGPLSGGHSHDPSVLCHAHDHHSSSFLSAGGHSHDHNSTDCEAGENSVNPKGKSDEACSHGHSHDCCGINHGSMNMASAMFHILVDFIHSFFVVITGISIQIVGPSSKFAVLFDTIASLILAFVIAGGVLVLGKNFVGKMRK